MASLQHAAAAIGSMKWRGILVYAGGVKIRLIHTKAGPMVATEGNDFGVWKPPDFSPCTWARRPFVMFVVNGVVHTK